MLASVHKTVSSFKTFLMSQICQSDLKYHPKFVEVAGEQLNYCRMSGLIRGDKHDFTEQ